jgi:hypothetical protein
VRGKNHVVSTEYSGQWDTGKKCGLGKLTTYNERGVAIETRTGYWHLGRPGRTHAGKPHGRNVYHDLRTGAWLDYEWNDGGFSRREKPVRWRFKDGMLYEGTFKWRKGGEREGTGALYGVNGQVLTDCALIGVSVTIHAHPFRFLSFGRSFSRESGRTSTRRVKHRRSAKRTSRR